jgi:hypothetical protein
MSLRSHGRYDYVPITLRTDYAWPGGKRLAVYVGLNLEHFAFGEGLGAELAPGGPQPDVLNYAWRDTATRRRVAAARNCRRAGAACSALISSSSTLLPQTLAAFRERGDRVGHGHTNAGASRSARGPERADRTRHGGDPHARGCRPRAGSAPDRAKPRDPDLLKECGYAYVLIGATTTSPAVSTRAGLLAVPYPQRAQYIRRSPFAHGSRHLRRHDRRQFRRDAGAIQRPALGDGVALHAYISRSACAICAARCATWHSIATWRG